MSSRRRVNSYRDEIKKVGSSKTGTVIGPVDTTLLTILIFLIVIGIMAVFSAGSPEGVELHNNPLFFGLRQTLYIGIGFFVMMRMAKYDYKKLKKNAKFLSMITLGLLFLTLIMGVGAEETGAARWLSFPPLPPFQPSELAKICCILLASSAMSDNLDIFSKKFWEYMVLIGAMIFLILLQPNMSMVLMLGATTAVLLLAGGFPIGLMINAAFVAIPFVIYKISHTSYQSKRIVGWLDPWADPQNSGYNLIQSLYAIASGGLLGVGYGNSKQKMFWLPERHTDFIFSVISEEFGFIGCLIVIGLFLAFLRKGFFIATKCPDKFGQMVAMGITFSVGLQAFINIAVTVGVLPVTGVTLPLISYGGTSVIITMAMMGILLNISRKRIKRINSYDELSEQY